MTVDKSKISSQEFATDVRFSALLLYMNKIYEVARILLQRMCPSTVAIVLRLYAPHEFSKMSRDRLDNAVPMLQLLGFNKRNLFSHALHEDHITPYWITAVRKSMYETVSGKGLLAHRPWSSCLFAMSARYCAEVFTRPYTASIYDREILLRRLAKTLDFAALEEDGDESDYYYSSFLELTTTQTRLVVSGC